MNPPKHRIIPPSPQLKLKGIEVSEAQAFTGVNQEEEVEEYGVFFDLLAVEIVEG
jgi:hypothetical protein